MPSEKFCLSETPTRDEKCPWVAPDWTETDIAAVTSGISFSYTTDSGNSTGS